MKTKTAFSMNSETMLKENTASKEKSNRRSRRLTTAATNACTATITIGLPIHLQLASLRPLLGNFSTTSGRQPSVG